MQLINPFERVAFGGLVLQGDAFRQRWRALPRTERKRLTTLVLQTRTGRDPHEAALLAGRAWQLQTQYAAAMTFASAVVIVLVFVMINGAEAVAGALGAFTTMPLVYAWQMRKLTAVAVKNVALITRESATSVSAV